MVAILIMLAKLVTLAFLKIRVFFNKGYVVISSVDDVSNKIMCDSNYFVDVLI